MSRWAVVGGSRGIGKAILDAAWKRGARVVSLSRQPVDEATRDAVQLDLRWPSGAIERAMHQTVEKLGGLDVLVLSGGMGAYLAPWQMSEERVEDLFQVNVLGPIQCYRLALRELMRSKGKVLFIGSTVARRPGASGLSVYAATKGAIDAFVVSEARRVAEHGIAINVLSPGWVDTEMTAEIKSELRARIVSAIPVRRMANAEEIAAFALAVLDQSHFLTGEVISMAGGG